jgi:hypothetical protein
VRRFTEELLSLARQIHQTAWELAMQYLATLRMVQKTRIEHSGYAGAPAEPIGVMIKMSLDVAASKAAHQAASFVYEKLRRHFKSVKTLRINGQLITIDIETMKHGFPKEIEKLMPNKNHWTREGNSLLGCK